MTKLGPPLQPARAAVALLVGYVAAIVTDGMGIGGGLHAGGQLGKRSPAVDPFGSYDGGRFL